MPPHSALSSEQTKPDAEALRERAALYRAMGRHAEAANDDASAAVIGAKGK